MSYATTLAPHDTLVSHEPAGERAPAAELPSYDGQPPAWMIPELPPAYGELAGKIAALRAEARKYEQIAGVLWQVGRPLAVSVRDLFSALQYEATLSENGGEPGVHVQLGGGRRLLVEVAGTPEAIDRKSPPISALLRILQDDVGDQDRLVLALNAWCDLPLDQRRQDPITPDALRLIQRLRANVVATSTLFGLWKYSFTDLEAARKSVIRLFSHDGGIFK